MRRCDECGAIAALSDSDKWSYGFANSSSLESTGPLMWLELFSGKSGPGIQSRIGNKFRCYKRFDLCSPKCVLAFINRRFEGAWRERGAIWGAVTPREKVNDEKRIDP